MATFYYNTTSSENYYSQWIKYRQNSSHVQDIVKSNHALKDVFYEQLQSVQDIIQESNEEQANAIRESANAVCGTLEEGFSIIDSQLDNLNLSLKDIRSELSSIASILDWNFSIVITEQKISNMLMGNIAQLLRIPDIQKERQYAVEQGLKFLKNVLFDEDFYEDALVNLLKAEKIEPTDYFILHHIGLIYLNSTKHPDILLAESYFRKAAKYAYAETLNNAATSHDILKLDASQFFENQHSVESIKLQAAETFMYVARCCYIRGSMSEAIENAHKGYALFPDLLEAGYLEAKANASLGRMNEALKILETLVDNNRFYMTKILTDKDFIGKKETYEFINKKRAEAVGMASEKVNYCKSIINQHSNVYQQFINVNKLIESNNYLAAKEALDFLG